MRSPRVETRNDDLHVVLNESLGVALVDEALPELPDLGRLQLSSPLPVLRPLPRPSADLPLVLQKGVDPFPLVPGPSLDPSLD